MLTRGAVRECHDETNPGTFDLRDEIPSFQSLFIVSQIISPFVGVSLKKLTATSYTTRQRREKDLALLLPTRSHEL